jgi:hypothetical protein
MLKKGLVLSAEFVFIVVGFIVSLASAFYLHLTNRRAASFACVFEFALICAALAWFRGSSAKWAVDADPARRLTSRSRRQLHPRRARYFRILQRFLLLLPIFCAAFVVVFLPLASHMIYSGTHLVPHYRSSTPLNWLILKSRDDIAVWTFFSNQGAARYGFTPIWFSRAIPSVAIFFTSDPEHPFGWRLPEGELAGGHTTHVAVRQFQLGMNKATCYEYEHTYRGGGISSGDSSVPTVLWDSLCSTQGDGVDYNLRAEFSGRREELPAFYDMLNSMTPAD